MTRSAPLPAACDLKGRRALVTGAAGGIGHSVVAALHRAGACVVGTDLVSNRPAQLADLLTPERYLAADLSEAGSADDVLLRASEGGPIDLLVNNAAMITSASLEETTADLLDQVYAVNLRAPLLLARAFAAQPDRRTPASIVNISSSGGLRAVRIGALAYGSLKAALSHATAYLARELGPEGITVNAVAPGSVASGHSTNRSAEAEGASLELRAQIRERTAVGRLGVPEEIADVVVFLASPAARYMTGQTLLVDGGWLLG